MTTVTKLPDEALHLAAQCWCDPETAGIEMDTRLATAFAKRLAALQKEVDALRRERDEANLSRKLMVVWLDSAVSVRDDALAAKEKAERELAVAREGAERYRWLREQGCGIEETDTGQVFDNWLAGDRLDRHIDAARAAQVSGEGEE